MTDAHHARAHSVWAASATSRNVVCSGAIAMETLCEDRESEAAAWGTCAHQISDHCLTVTSAPDANVALGKMVKIGKFEFVVDEEMINCAQEYIDWVRQESAGAEWLKVEQNFSLAPINPPLEAGGTCDALYYHKALRRLSVDDLKGGRGVVVEVIGNPQARSYALGALLAHPDLDVETIRITIIQPRAQHKDGRIRSETFHVTDLLDWTYDLLQAMGRSKQALDEFLAIMGRNTKNIPDRDVFETWADKWLATGQCIFCPAKASCPKVRAEALATAGKNAEKWFETPGDTSAVVVPEPNLATPEQLSHWLDGFEMLEGWIKACRSHAHALAERGTAIPGYQLAEKIGNRAWIEKDEAKLATLIKRNFKLANDEIFDRSVKSIAQIEKVLGSKRKGEMEAQKGKLWTNPVRGTNLVAVSKTTRPPALSKPETFFETVK